jgi:hypothetical protein
MLTDCIITEDNVVFFLDQLSRPLPLFWSTSTSSGARRDLWHLCSPFSPLHTAEDGTIVTHISQLCKRVQVRNCYSILLLLMQCGA